MESIAVIPNDENKCNTTTGDNSKGKMIFYNWNDI